MKRIRDVTGKISTKGLRSSAATLVTPPAVAVAMAGQGKTRGTVALVLALMSGNQSVALVRPHREYLDASYLFYNLDWRYSELRSRSDGDGRAGLTKSIIGQIPIALPSLSEQDRIVEILDAIDRQITYVNVRRAKLEYERQAILEDIFPASHEEMQSLGEVTADDPQNGLYKPASMYGRDGAPIVRIDAISSGRIANPASLHRVRVSDGERSRYGLLVDDILVNRVNSLDLVGKSAIVEVSCIGALFESNIMRVTVDPSKAVPAYVISWLQTPLVMSHFKRSAKSAISQASINQSDLCSCPFPQASLADQRKAVEVIRLADLQSATLDAESVKWTQIRQGLMDDLLSGRVQVRLGESPGSGDGGAAWRARSSMM